MPIITFFKSEFSSNDFFQSLSQNRFAHTFQLFWNADSFQFSSRRIFRGITKDIDFATWKKFTDNEFFFFFTNFSSSSDFFSLIYFSTSKQLQALLSDFSRRKLFSEFINRIANLDKDFWKIVKRKFHKFTNSQMKNLATMKENAKRKRKKTKKKKKEKLKIEKNIENEKNDKKNTKIFVSLTRQMFKFLSKNLRLKIVSQFNFIHFFNLLLSASKKLKSIPMIKMTVKIYHDSAPAHKFKNKITKFKIERLMFFLSKSIRNEQSALTLTEEFDELTVENQIFFAEDYETAKKKQNMHENILKFHAAELAREEEKYWNQIKKWALKKKLWEWKTITMLFDECFFQFYFLLDLDGIIKFIEKWQSSDDFEKKWKIHKSIKNIDLKKFDNTSNEKKKTDTISSISSKSDKSFMISQKKSFIIVTAIDKVFTKVVKKSSTFRKSIFKK